MTQPTLPLISTLDACAMAGAAAKSSAADARAAVRIMLPPFSQFSEQCGRTRRPDRRKAYTASRGLDGMAVRNDSESSSVRPGMIRIHQRSGRVLKRRSHKNKWTYIVAHQ